MENIVRLEEYRARRERARAPRPRAQDGAAQYFCTRCDSDTFRLGASGIVHCAHCGALMRNLLVTASPSREEA